MAEKMDYRSKKKMNKKLKIALIVVLSLFVIYIISQSIIRAYRTIVEQKPPDDKNGTFYSVKNYNSLKELLNSYGCSYIREKMSNEALIIYVKFDRDLYTGKTSNEVLFMNILKAVAEFENYKNFELIDETRDIHIKVTCEETSITQVEINGDKNYYLNHDSKINSSKNSVKITDFSVQSEELQAFIDTGWISNNVNLGNKDSSCNNYDIYFNRGIEIRTIGRKVYNLIFTEKYNGNVAGNLNASSTIDDVEEALGEPTFSEGTLIYGYLGENNYLFFDFINKEVSVYPVISLSSNEEEKFTNLIKTMNSSSDIKNFAMDLTSLWIDYDEYDYDSNYVELKYALRGIELNISNQSLKNGIYIYQNYSGSRNIQDLDNVYITDKDFVFEEEKSRVNKETINRTEEGDYTEEELAEMGNKFAVRFRDISDYKERGPLFYSRNKEYPDSELSRTLVISSWDWYDDYNLIYSVDNDGIYAYNCVNFENTKIADVPGEIQINSAGNGRIVYNENQVINVQ